MLANIILVTVLLFVGLFVLAWASRLIDFSIIECVESSCRVKPQFRS